MFRAITRTVLGLAVVCVLCAGQLAAQIAGGTIVGTIQDASQALVPGVKVTARHVTTGQTFAAVTTTTGDYVLSQLPVGEYEIQAEAPSFATAIKKGVVLQIGKTIRIDFSLTVGQVSQNVEVSTQAPLLDTDESSVGQVIGNRQVESLPLNGRDWLSLTTLVPGVLPTADHIQGGGLHANNFLARGLRRSDNIVYLNGALIVQGNGGTTFLPSVDAIQEFQIKSGLYDAEFGIMPGVQIVAITKSGTNELHGDAFEFLRNDRLDARNFFEQKKAPFKRNEFGGTVGGPIYIPHVWNGKNKGWFFLSYQKDSIRQFAPATGVVPTDAEKSGVFPTTIIDPQTDQPFPNNTIPPDRISTISQQFLQFWPEPNTPGALNFTSPNTSLATDNSQWMSRVDFDTSQNNRWMLQLTWAANPINGPSAIQAFSFHLPITTWVASIANTHTFAGKYVNEAGIHFHRRPFILEDSKLGCDFSKTLGPQFSQGVDACGVPIVNVQGLTGLGSFSVIGPVIVGNWLAKDHLAFQHGSHSLRIGGDFRRSYNLIKESARSIFDFAARYTGNGFADFLLGLPDFTRQQGPLLTENLNQNSMYYYVQDEWRVTPRLSLSLGLRYEWRLPWKDKDGTSANFDPATGTFFPPLDGTTGRFERSKPLVTWSPASGFLPRLGLAYRLGDKTVVRAGYGIYGGEPIVGMIQQLGVNPRPGSAILTFNSGLTSPTITFSDPFPSGQGQTGGVPSAGGVDSPIALSRTHDWGLSVQRELVQNWLVDIGYEGSYTSDQTEGVGLNDAKPGPGAIQPRRPYPNLGYMSFYKADGTASYNGLQLKVVKRPGPEGLSLLTAFTWSKAIDDSDSRLDIDGEPEDRSVNVPNKANRALSSGNIGRRLVVTADYQLPFGAGKAYAKEGLASKVAGGWSVQEIATFSDGPWVTVFLPGDTLNVGSTDSQWPDKICNPNLPSSQRTPSRWFNTACFAVPAPFTYGNAGRSTVEGPGIINFDTAVHREFRITERQSLQFRAEMFNTFNHPNFLIPGGQFGTASFGVIGGAQDPRQIQFGLKYIF